VPSSRPAQVNAARPAPVARAGAGTGVGAALVGELLLEQFDGLPDGLADQSSSAGLVQCDDSAADGEPVPAMAWLADIST
jgi:hypothetical protein